MPRKLDGSYIQTGSITTTQLSSQVTQVIEAGGGPRVTSLVYPGDDTAANTVGGQTVYIVGSGFETNNAIYINGSAVPAKSFISASNLSFTTPALSEGIYPVYVINTDTGATAIYVPGLTVSNEPTWISSAAIDAGETWEISLSATGDGQITYALANGSSLPGGISLAANGLISGTLTSPPENDTQYTFTVVASDAQNQDSSRQFTVTVSTGEGALFANNVLLIHADGTNNQNNHTFLDSSSNGYTITRAGNATQGSFSPFSQTGWSGYFDGSGDYLSLASNAVFGFGTGDFTIECWLYPITQGGHGSFNNDCILDFRPGTSTGSYGTLYISQSGTGIYWFADGANRIAGAAIPNNAWAHVVISRASGNTRLFINGAQSGSTFSDSINYATSSVWLGQMNDTDKGGFFNGYMSNLRIIKGTALYTTNFTPPTTVLTAVSNTSLLTLQSNRFIDNSTNAFTITRNGDVSIQAFSPFAPTAAYSTANVGGSAYFDGTVDNLVITNPGSPMDFGTGDFTIDFWVYSTVAGAQRTIISSNNASWETGSAVISGTGSGDGLRMRMGVNGTVSIADPNDFELNTWNYYMFTRSGTNFNLYKNGTRVATSSGSGTVNFGNNNGTKIGGGTWDGASSYITGYISNVRAIKGTALFTGASCDVPTAPLTNVANTSLLLNFTNAGIFDQTAKNVLETVGDAKVSTAQYKYGTGSMYFDGTGDYLKIPNTPAFNLSAGDWTIECWINLSALTAEARIWSLGTYGSNPEVALLIGGGGAGGSSNDLQFNYLGNSTLITASSVNSTGVWMHVAVVRYSGTTTLYVNGVSKGTTATNPWTSSSTSFWIGGWSQNNNQMTGYIDDLRITKGYARYTTNFTPPASALKDK